MDGRAMTNLRETVARAMVEHLRAKGEIYAAKSLNLSATTVSAHVDFLALADVAIAAGQKAASGLTDTEFSAALKSRLHWREWLAGRPGVDLMLGRRAIATVYAKRMFPRSPPAALSWTADTYTAGFSDHPTCETAKEALKTATLDALVRR